MAEPQPDYSHTAFEWNEASRALVGVPVGASGARTMLSLLRFEVGVVGGSQLPLHGRTLSEALAWLSDQLGVEGLSRPDLTVPPHPVANGGLFDKPDDVALKEMDRWFSASAGLLDAVHKENEGASTVRCWPHHFDIATLITLDPDEPDHEKARSIGVGMSPGDETYPEPYLYVTPWPYPPTDGLEDLPFGHWHKEGFVAAVLAGTDISTAGAADRPERVARFTSSAIDACRRHLA